MKWTVRGNHSWDIHGIFKVIQWDGPFRGLLMGYSEGIFLQ
jgi:hypothetical protein